MIYDFTNAQKVLQEDFYHAIVTDVKSRDSKSGKAMKIVSLEIKDSGKVSDFFVEVPKAYWKIQNFLKACQLPYEGKVKMSDDWKEVLAKKVQIQVGVEEYNGTKRNIVKGYFRDDQKLA